MRSARKAKSSEVGCHDRRELGGQAFGLAEHRPYAAGSGLGRGQVTEAAALGDPVGPALLLVQWMEPRLASVVVGQKGPGHPFGPARLPVLGPVGDVDHPEQVAPIGRRHRPRPGVHL